MPSIAHYLSVENPLYRHPVFGTIMTRNRFQRLLKCLYFHDNSTMPQRGDADYDRPYKIRPVLNHLNKKFQLFYTSRRAIYVDESLLLQKG